MKNKWLCIAGVAATVAVLTAVAICYPLGGIPYRLKHSKLFSEGLSWMFLK